jgi:hypothetical protein
MGGQIENALVELITNSDDSYIRLEQPDQRARGSIRVEVEHRRSRRSAVIVRDRAEGMTAGEMKEKLTRLGAQTSGQAVGLGTRGSRGRGGKDIVAFGPATWESIKDDRYYYLKLGPSGDWVRDKRGARATPDDRKRLGVPKDNGTVVTLQVDSSRFPVPQHETLAKRLTTHFRLRNIMMDDRRQVRLVNLNTGESTAAMRYHYPEEYYRTKPVLDERFELPGYDGAEAHITVWRHSERFSEDKRSPYRQGGILITSGRDVHEITLFKFERESYAEWFFGTLDVPYIGALSTEYDKRLEMGIQHAENNPFSVLRVDHSLNDEHPFARALKTAGEARLQQIVAEEREREKQLHSRIENAETQARLKRLASAASRFIVAKLKEFDEALPIIDVGQSIPNGFAIIPPEKKIRAQQPATLSILVRDDLLDASSVVEVESDHLAVQVDPGRVTVHPHRARPEVLCGTFKVVGSEVGAMAVVQARIDGLRPAEAIVEVVPEDSDPREPPQTLCFERDQYFIAYGKEKSVRILAPSELMRSAGNQVQVSSDRPEIVVRRQAVEMKYDAELLCWAGMTRLEGRQLHAHGNIQARVGQALAEAKVRVVQRETGGLPFEFHVDNKDYGSQRAIWDPPDGYSLSIAGKHESVGRYLGPAERGFPFQNTPHFLVLLAEIIADSVCRRLLELEGEKRGQDWVREMDVDAFYREHYRYMGEFVPLAHRCVLSAGDLQVLKAESQS